MGSSETGGGSVEGVLDSSVGSIVWVRRRNGSWWPGKVLGTDELSTSHLTSPRSGTPVKLLGREDASVDWYNLEKSKRVKAFRCGEFDVCIERAEAAQGIPPKKREKYARREDAILHALELERQLLEKKYGKLGFSMNDMGKRLSDAVASSGHLENGGGNQTSPRSNKISEEHSSSPADKDVTCNANEETLKEGNDLSGDDSNACTIPRMRGLQDFGLRTTPIKEELSGVTLRAKRGRYTYLNDDFGNCLDGSGLPSSEREISVPVFEDTNDPLYCADLSEEPISRSTEDTETDCSETVSLESGSDDDITALSDDGSYSIELQPKYPLRTEVHEEYGSINSHDLDGSVFADATLQPFSIELASTSSMEESKWHLKGKRNNCHLGKRSLGKIDAGTSRGYMSRRNSNRNNKGFKTDSTRSFRTHLQDPCQDNLDFEGLAWNSPAVRGDLEYLQEGDDRHQFRGRIILVDVDLKVEASNYRRDVPMISLMSKLNGHAIVGHPIQVEALENGSSQNLFSGSEYYFTKPLESPHLLPRVWRTGRRTTNFRVPRPNFFSTLDSESRMRTLASQDRKLPFGSEQGSFSQKANIIRNRFSQYDLDGKFLRSSPKKTSMSSNPKIRTLSSIESEHKHHYNPLSGGTTNQDDGLIKTKYLPTPIACIPVNLVFSRLHEELDGRRQ